ncbi:MAG: SWIM zinc finger domain-containing protein [Saprospiraceae bacterium]|nr:SWIM zinc finger domain-containing protein [Saprospiraceae bacterium]
MLFNYKYGGTSSVASNANSTAMSFAPDTLREPTFFVGQLSNKIPFREAISALNAVVVSDLRFKPQDKTAYLEWAKQQEELWLAEYMGEMVNMDELNNRIKDINTRIKEINTEQGKIMGPFNKAKREYFNYLYEKDKDAWFVLDPVITVHPDEMFFECFSQDESTYGKLSCSYNVFKNINEFECGTTNIDYSSALYNEFQKIRDYKETDFKVDPSGFEVQTGNDDLYKEVKIDLPASWVRGFLQVSSAMTLPATSIEMHPMDIYNICLYLRRFKETKGPRSLRFKLEPNQPVKIIVEPWNYEIKCVRSFYHGKDSKEIRIWGRRRLLTLERLIPIARRFTVTLLGSGLPSFYEADLGDMVFTLGLSGWTANDWSRAGNFDLMAPRTNVDATTKKTVFEALKKNWKEDIGGLSNRLGLSTDIVSGALAAYTQAGRVIYDRYNGVYRVRELSRDPLDMKQLRFSSPQEEKANQLVNSNKVQLEVENLGDGKVKLKGTVQDRYRTYNPILVIDADERIIQASCDCNHYNMNKMRKGPCEHMLALRIAYNKRIGKII